MAQYQSTFLIKATLLFLAFFTLAAASSEKPCLNCLTCKNNTCSQCRDGYYLNNDRSCTVCPFPYSSCKIGKKGKVEWLGCNSYFQEHLIQGYEQCTSLQCGTAFCDSCSEDLQCKVYGDCSMSKINKIGYTGIQKFGICALTSLLASTLSFIFFCIRHR